MAKKKKSVSIPNLRNQLRKTLKEVQGLEKDLEQVQANLERFLNRPRFGGDDEYFVDLRAMTRRRR